MADYTALDGGFSSSPPGSPVCPSTPDYTSTNVFKVEANTSGAGHPDEFIFQWVVYGGTIQTTGFYGDIEVNIDTQEDPGAAGVHFSQVTLKGTGGIGPDSSMITVEWDAVELEGAWVAVRQFSQWSCSDSAWSVATQDIFNAPPVFETIPTDIQIAYGHRNNFELFMPAVNDPDGCANLRYDYEVKHNGNVIESGNDVTEAPVLDLNVGTDSVFWTITDNTKSLTTEYAITVDPLPVILNVAWLEPSCAGNNDGELVISGKPAYAYPGPVQYKIEDGTFSDVDRYTALWAGDTTIQARVDYAVDKNYDGDTNDPGEIFEQLSPEYTISLNDPVTGVINDNDIPQQGSEYVEVTNTGCLNDSDGAILVNTENMDGLRNSVYFDGVDDYLLLNKSYDNTLNEFSVAAWIKLPEIPKRGTLISFDAYDYFQLDVTYNLGKAGMRFYSMASGGLVITNDEIKLNDGQWHLIVASFNNGEHSLFVDGAVTGETGTQSTVGASGRVRYGMIGANNTDINNFENLPRPDFFKGYIAEMAIWDDNALDAADVENIRKNGISSYSPDDHWLLNNVPSYVSGSNPQDTIFTDLGNRGNGDHWARFYNNPSRSDNNNPLLFSWSDDAGGTAGDYPAGPEIEDIIVGDYTLQMNDIMGCGSKTETYSVGNDDEEGPLLLWNVALRKPVSGFTGTAGNVTDGDAGTTVNTQETQLKIDLGNQYNILRVLVHRGNEPLEPYTITFTDVGVIDASYIAQQQRPSRSTNDTVSVDFAVSARYVWLQSAPGGNLSDIAEVEIFTSDAMQPRIFHLSDANDPCFYEIMGNDLGIYPFAYDACMDFVPVSYTTYRAHPELTDDTSLEGGEFLLGADTVRWTATDDIGKEARLTVPFVLLDTVSPYFYNNLPPFRNMDDTLTYCKLHGSGGHNRRVRLPIPQAIDNYMNCIEDEPFKSVLLKLNGIKMYEFSEDDMSSYDYTANDSVDILIAESPGYGGFDYEIVWVVTDHSDNILTDTIDMRIEAQPQVRNIRISPNRCSNNQNHVVFTDIQSEPGRTVNYYLENTDTQGQSYHNISGTFSNIDTGSYNAYIEVNGCRSHNYYRTIVIDEPLQYNLSAFTVEPVQCSGFTDGAINLSSESDLGGSQSTVLHFWGQQTGPAASVPNYNQLNLTSEGTLEARIYLDTLGAGHNQDVGLALVGDDTGHGYGLRMANGNLQFYVGNNSVETSISDTVWYHVTGTWDENSISLVAHSAYGDATASTTVSNAAFSSTGGSLYIGSGASPGANVVRGFVGSVRVWDKKLDNSTITINRYLKNPIDKDTALMANLLIDDGGNTLQNQVAQAPDGSVQATNIRWQKFAYYWAYNNSFVARTHSIENLAEGDYKLSVHDPNACTAGTIITMYNQDNDPPEMRFSNDGYNQSPFLIDGGNIWRYTDDDGGEVYPQRTAVIKTEATGFCDFSLNMSVSYDSQGNPLYISGGYNRDNYIEWNIWGGEGEYTFRFRYQATRSGNTNHCNLFVNSNDVADVDFTYTGYSNWETLSVPVNLSGSGYKRIRLEGYAVDYNGIPRAIEYISITGPGVIASECDDSTPEPTYGDCVYVPSAKEFDPVIDDGVCNADSVEVSLEVLRGGNLPDGTPTDGLSGLDGIGFSDSVTVRWTATDKAGQSSQRDIRYSVVDRLAPMLLPSGDGFSNYPAEEAAPDSFVVIFEADDNCAYTIGNGEFVPQVIDNCGQGNLYNTHNYTDNLNGIELSMDNVYEYEWYFEENDLSVPDAETGINSAHLKYSVIGIDNYSPSIVLFSNSQIPTKYLNESGYATVSYDEIINMNNYWTRDNCGIDEIGIAKNVAFGKPTVQSDTVSSEDDQWGRIDYLYQNGHLPGFANDGGYDSYAMISNTGGTGSWWEVDLGGQYKIHSIKWNIEKEPGRIYSSPRAHIFVSNSTSSNSGFGSSKPNGTGGNVVYSTQIRNPNTRVNDIHGYIPGTGTSTEIVGRHVRIWLDDYTDGLLRVYELEVFATPVGGNIETLTLNCDDARNASHPYDILIGQEGDIPIYAWAKDAAGNSTYRDHAELQVRDDIMPAISANVGFNANLNEEGWLDLDSYVQQIDAGTWDNCSVDSMWFEPHVFECGVTQQQDVTFYARDINGNISSQQMPVNIVDNIPPEVSVYNYVQLELNELGYYVIDPENDLVRSASDNCSSTLFYTVEPDTVYCHQAGQYVDLTLTVSDENGNDAVVEIKAEDNTAMVLDLLPPVATTSDYTLTIDEDGQEAVAFEDIISETNITDNCGGQIQRAIKYNDTYINWCPAGSEGLEENADELFTNIADLASNNWPARYDNQHIIQYIKDNSLGSSFVSAAKNGEVVQIEYTFDKPYQINASNVIWHQEEFIYERLIHSGYMRALRNEPYNSYFEEAPNIFDGDLSTYFAEFRSYVEAIIIPFYTPKVITRTRINWHEDYVPDIQRRLDYRDGYSTSAWTEIGDFGANQYMYNEIENIDVEATDLRLSMDAYKHGGGNDFTFGIRELQIYGYNADERDCKLPASATLEYTTDGTTWQTLHTQNTINASEYYHQFSKIEVLGIRLTTTTDAAGRMGIKEWQVMGREACSETADNCIPCTNFTCNDVHTNVPVWLQYTDQFGNSASTEVAVPVVPYFDISEVQIKNCGTSGQRYYPVIENFSPNNDTYYSWDEVNDGPANIALFQYPGDDYRSGDPYFDQGGNGSPENIANSALPYVRNHPVNYAYLRADGTTAPPGNYEIELTVTDHNGCWDSNITSFDAGQTQAVAVNERDVCFGDTETFKLSFPSNETTFWQMSSRNIVWDYDNTVVYNAGYGDGHDSIWITFNSANNGNPIDISYAFSGNQLNPDNPQIHTGDGSTTVGCSSGDPCHQILGQNGSVYWISDDITTPRTFSSDQQYLIGNSSWLNSSCTENLVYRATVINIPDIQLEVNDHYVSNAWVDADGYQVCPMDTLNYRVPNSSEYDFFEWDILDIGDNATGTVVEGGNSNDDFIRVRWDKYPLDPQINVTAYKRKSHNPQKSCSKTHTYQKPFNDTEPPVVDCGAVPTIEANNTPGFCYTNLSDQQIVVPPITDNCRNRIASYYSSNSGKVSAAGIYQVGENPVGWAAVDYSGNVGDTCYYTVEVLDNEAPDFNNIPGGRPFLNVDQGECTYTFPDNSLDVTANDNCPANDGNLWVRASVYALDGSGGERQSLLDDSLETLFGFNFPVGYSEVVWYAHDSIDNDNNGTFENIDSISIMVGVRDNIPPELNLVNIEANADNNCSANVTIPGIQPTDNCSSNQYMADHVVFNRRTDGRQVDEAFDTGETGVIYIATDEAGNSRTDTLIVTVHDITDPVVSESDPFIQDMEIGYCMKDDFRLGIPEYSDNCRVWSITCRVLDSGGQVYWEQTVDRDGHHSLDPNASGYLIVGSLDADAGLGADYTVEWSFEDDYGNTSEVYDFDLRVQVSPCLGDLELTEITCGGAKNGKIVVVEDPNTGYRAEEGAVVEYAINNNWDNAQTHNLFEGLGAGEYDIRMRVNGCYSETKTVILEGAETYSMQLVASQPYCYEDSTGQIDVLMSGGVNGQLVLGGSALTASYYPGLDSMATNNDGSGSGSIEAWVYANEITNSTILAKGSDYSLAIETASDTSLVFSVGSDQLQQAVSLYPGRWYYVVGTWSQTQMNLFVDGQQIASQTGSFGFTAGQTGWGNVTVANGFKGLIRELGLWSRYNAGGVQPQAKLSGAETHLQAYWPLSDGSGAQADNKVEGAEPLSGLNPNAWSSSSLQPGTYTWYKDGAFFTSDSVNLTNLPAATYQLTFTDMYGCPQGGLGQSVLIDATDMAVPAIESITGPVVYTGENDCEYIVKETDSHLWPTINDPCNYEVTWEVVPYINPIGQLFEGEKGDDDHFTGARLELGTNQVFVTVTQNNGRVIAEREYEITVRDTIKPNAVANDITEVILLNINDPMGSGYVEYDAYDLNNNSTDNCTPREQLSYSVSADYAVDNPVFKDSARFTCDDVGRQVQVAFKVTDASGNSSVIQGNEVIVRDDNPPEFTNTTVIEKRLCATDSDQNGVTPDWVNIPTGQLTLDENDYTDNCTVRGIRYTFDYFGYGLTVLDGGPGYGWLNTAGPYTSWSEDHVIGYDGFAEDFYFDTGAGGNRFYEGTTEIMFRLYDGYNDSDGEIENNLQIVYRVIVLPRPDLEGHGIE